MEWCISAESGLPDPDLTILLEISPQMTQSRDGYGDEIHDVPSLQNSVANIYNRLFMQNSWCRINAQDPMNVIHQEILNELSIRRRLLNLN